MSAPTPLDADAGDRAPASYVKFRVLSLMQALAVRGRLIFI